MKRKKNKRCDCDETNVFVKLAGVLGGILLVIVLFFLIFAKDQLIFATSIAWAFAILGMILGFFMYLSKKLRK